MKTAELLGRVIDAGGWTAARGRERVVRSQQPLPPDLLAELQAYKSDLLTVLAANTDCRGEPAGPCPACGSRLWWRAAVFYRGSGTWTCASCVPAPEDIWQEACVVGHENAAEGSGELR